MASMNTVHLIGNLTRDVAIRNLPSGMSVADLSLAINERYTDKAGDVVKNTCFVDVVVWDKQADACAKYLRKGSPVLVEGMLQTDEWKNDKGEKRSKLRVRANRVEFLGAPKLKTQDEVVVPAQKDTDQSPAEVDRDGTNPLPSDDEPPLPF